MARRFNRQQSSGGAVADEQRQQRGSAAANARTAAAGGAARRPPHLEGLLRETLRICNSGEFGIDVVLGSPLREHDAKRRAAQRRRRRLHACARAARLHQRLDGRLGGVGVKGRIRLGKQSFRQVEQRHTRRHLSGRLGARRRAVRAGGRAAAASSWACTSAMSSTGAAAASRPSSATPQRERTQRRR